LGTREKSSICPPEALIEGLKGTLFATSPDEAKQVLAGVHLKVLQDCLEFAATDGHRLALVQTANEKSRRGKKQKKNLK
jgi:DNA polymerase III, beta subunit (EC 2.7.7.7)